MRLFKDVETHAVIEDFTHRHELRHVFFAPTRYIIPCGAGVQGLHGPHGRIDRMLGQRGLARARVARALFKGFLDPRDRLGKGVRGQFYCIIETEQDVVPCDLATIKQKSGDPPEIPA